MRIEDAQYEWTPLDWPVEERTLPRGRCRVYRRDEDDGRRQACWNNVDKPNLRGPGELLKWKRLAFLLVDFHKMVVRDGLDPQVVHREFLKIDEYRKFIPLDTPGAEE